MQLRINSQMAMIGLKTTQPTVDLRMDLPEIQLESNPPRVEITSTMPKISIDQSQCFADEGHRGLLDFALYCSEYSREQFSEGIDQTVSDGNNLAAINSGFSIADLGVEAMEDDQHVFEIRAIPQQPPVIEFDIQPVSIRCSQGQVEVNIKEGKIKNNYQPGQVDTYLAQRNYLNIQWIDDHQLDKTV